MARRLGLAQLIDSRPCRRRDLVLGMIVQRVLKPASKLALYMEGRHCSLAKIGYSRNGKQGRVRSSTA